MRVEVVPLHLEDEVAVLVVEDEGADVVGQVGDVVDLEMCPVLC